MIEICSHKKDEYRVYGEFTELDYIVTKGEKYWEVRNEKTGQFSAFFSRDMAMAFVVSNLMGRLDKD